MLASFWMVGSLYSASTGWLVIPAYGWRAFLLAATVPAWTCTALCATFMPESPRFLTVAGRQDEALQARYIAEMQHRHFYAVSLCNCPLFDLIAAMSVGIVRKRHLESH